MASVEFTYSNLKTKVGGNPTTIDEAASVASCTSATSERSFSSLRLVKTYTMNQDRLNYFMMIYVHKDLLTSKELWKSLFSITEQHLEYTFN